MKLKSIQVVTCVINAEKEFNFKSAVHMTVMFVFLNCVNCCLKADVLAFNTLNFISQHQTSFEMRVNIYSPKPLTTMSPLHLTGCKKNSTKKAKKGRIITQTLENPLCPKIFLTRPKLSEKTKLFCFALYFCIF